MSKKDKKSKNTKSSHSNNAVECKCHEHEANGLECHKDNCTCTKHNNCGTLTQGE